MLDQAFFDKEKDLQEKLRTVQMGKLDKSIEPPKPKNKNPYNNYYQYHRKPNIEWWKKLWE